MTFRVVLAKSSAFRRSVAGAFEFARTGAMALIAFCASVVIFALFSQSVLLLAIVGFLSSSNGVPQESEAFIFFERIQETDRMSTFGSIGVSAAIREHTRSRMLMAIFKSESGDSTSLKPSTTIGSTVPSPAGTASKSMRIRRNYVDRNAT